MMKNIKMIISYDGGPFLGWQKTSAGPSIQELLEKALKTITGQSIPLQAASRTDAGVHAQGQVVNFLLTSAICIKKLWRSLNGLLPKEIRVIDLHETYDSFHPTLDNIGKEYHYYLCTQKEQLPFHGEYSWHFPSIRDLDKIHKGTKYLEGFHDFSAFCNDRLHFSRDPYCQIDRINLVELEQGRLLIKIAGSRFLYKMVRNIIGTLAYIGSGKISVETLPIILESKSRSLAGITAPAHGLHLHKVFYLSSIRDNTLPITK